MIPRVISYYKMIFNLLCLIGNKHLIFQVANIICISFDFEDSFIWQTKQYQLENRISATAQLDNCIPRILLLVEKGAKNYDVLHEACSNSHDTFVKVQYYCSFYFIT